MSVFCLGRQKDNAQFKPNLNHAIAPSFHKWRWPHSTVSFPSAIPCGISSHTGAARGLVPAVNSTRGMMYAWEWVWALVLRQVSVALLTDAGRGQKKTQTTHPKKHSAIKPYYLWHLPPLYCFFELHCWPIMAIVQSRVMYILLLLSKHCIIDIFYLPSLWTVLY